MKKIFLFLLTCCFSFALTAQQLDRAAIDKLVEKNAKDIIFSADKASGYLLNNAYSSNGIDYVYLNQTYQGIPVQNRLKVLAFRDGQLLSQSGEFAASGLQGQVSTPSVTAQQAVAAAFRDSKLTAPASLKVVEVTETGRKLNFGVLPGVTENVTAELIWYASEKAGKSSYELSWQVQVIAAKSEDGLLTQISAVNGTVLGHFNLTSHDNWGHKNHVPGILKSRGAANDQAKSLFSPYVTSPEAITSADYLVIKYPAESPSYGAAAIHTSPWLMSAGNATTLGWHSTSTTVDYNYTRGNNVWATEDRAASNQNTGSPATSTTGIPALTFNFPPNYTIPPTTTSFQNFAITNLFYWNNLVHDATYQYGFTEAARNFQNNNLGRGGAQNDDVIALAQSGAGTNNANFLTPADGGRGRMRMYLFDRDTINRMVVNTPAAIAGDYFITESVFSPNNKLAAVGPITADLAYFNDGAGTHEACSGPPTNSLTGKIALIDRGNCAFVIKVQEAQAAGAVAVIMVNNVAGPPLLMAGTEPSITIPAVMVSNTDGAILAAQIGNTINVTLSGQATQDLDGDLDAGIICHEFGHGVSNRLTGNGVTCLQNAEQAGEGWGDYLGLMMTTNWATAAVGDGVKKRPVGTYVLAQSPVGGGIRNYPYSTNIAINPLKYEHMALGAVAPWVNGSPGSEVHNLGEIWTVALWEMTWNIIAQENSINTQFFAFDQATTTGGNSIAMKLVLEGMKLQPCGPGFIDGRNAILAADRNLYAGRHACSIWTAFAKRGMGQGASQGSANSATDQTASSALPGAPTVTTQPQPITVAAGATATFTASAGTDVNLIYRWQVSTNGGTNWTDIVPAQIGTTLTLTNVTTAMSGNLYRAVVSVACATTNTNSAALTVTGASTPSVTLTSAPATTTQTVCVNTAITNITYSTAGGVTGVNVTGLPTGVTFVYSGGTNGTITISGTPATTTGSPFTFNITTTPAGGTATGTITVNPNNTITLTSAAGTANQTVAVSTAITPITYSTSGGVTGVTVTGLPTGVTGTYSGGTNGTFTISGSPTTCNAAPYNFTVTTTGGACTQSNLTGSINVPCGPAISLTSAASTNAQTVCVNTAIVNIVYQTSGGVTGATVTGLPAGVTGTYTGTTNGTFTISGTPTAVGNTSYTITTSGGTGPNATAAGTINVNGASAITLSSAAGTNAQTVCTGVAIANITYTTTNGVSAATVSGLPAGVTGTFSGSTVTISGTPTATGTFTYTVNTSGGCGTPSTTGTITVNAGAAITLTSAAGTNNQTICITSAITPITYSSANGVTGMSVTGLPAGVTGTYTGTTNGTFTISGTPTATGTFNYTVSSTGGCGAPTATGTIVVNPAASVTLSSAAGTNAQTRCVNTPITNITYTTAAGVTGANVTGLPAGVAGTFSGSTVTISGTPTATGTFTYTVTTTGGCGTASATGTITVSPNTTITLTSAASTTTQSVCLGSAITAISYSTANGATGVTVTGLPAGVSGVYTGTTNGTFTISGTPTAGGVFNYTVTIAGGCGTASLSGTITVSTPPTITSQPTSITSCSTTATFSVTASGAGLSYQWQVSTDGGVTWTNIPAAQSSTLTLTGLTTAQANYRYRVVITSACGNTTSNAVTAQIGTPPVVVLTAAPSTVYNPSQNGGLFATVSPVGNYVYQWKRDSQILPVLGSSITAANGLLYSFGTYTVTAVDVATGCSGTSNAVTITDNPSVRNTLFMSPNPTDGMVRVSFYSDNLVSQARTIAIFDEKGAKLSVQDFTVTGTYGFMMLDMRKMVRGSYLVVLFDANGKKIASDRVIRY